MEESPADKEKETEAAVTEKERVHFDAGMPPVKAGWICLAVAWALFLIPVPGTGLIGWALNVAAFIISIINMVKGRVGAGVAQLVCVLVVSPMVYFAGLGILWSHMMSRPEHYQHRILL